MHFPSRLFPLLLGVVLAVPLAIGREYNDDNLQYTDTAGWDLQTSVSVSVLTRDGILRGDPQGTFRAGDNLNRAEFMAIVMRLLAADAGIPIQPWCFTDINPAEWYADPVCRAKNLGIIHGNPRRGVPASQWRFEPARAVQYEEAVKVLVRLYAIPTTDGGINWYDRYLQAAQANGLSLAELLPGDKLKRGEMARLVAAFRAYSEGELELLRAAERGETASSMSSTLSSSSHSSQKSSSTSVASVSSASSVAGVIDQLPAGIVRANVLVTGETSPVLASVSFFSTSEPVDARKIIITLGTTSPSIDSFLVYDEDKRYLGRATLSSGTAVYTLTIPSGMLTLPRRENVSVYVRAIVKEDEQGAVSGENVQVASIRVEGDGMWSNESYGQTSTDTFPIFEIARGSITSIINAGPAEAVVTAGNDRLLGEFRFDGVRGDAEADLRLQSLIFQLESSGVTVSNIELRAEGADTAHSCSLSSSTITCSSIPSVHGSLTSGPKTIRLYGDVTINSGAQDPYFRLTLNAPGDTSTTGAVTWTDGDVSFSWVPFDAPIVRGTLYR